MSKIKNWNVVIEWDDNTTSYLGAEDFAPDIAGYLKQFMQEVEAFKTEMEDEA